MKWDFYSPVNHLALETAPAHLPGRKQPMQQGLTQQNKPPLRFNYQSKLSCIATAPQAQLCFPSNTTVRTLFQACNIYIAYACAVP